MLLADLTAWLDRELNLEKFAADHSNNGLQAEGSGEVTRAVFGVDACLELFEAAAAAEAQFVFVHHGLSWGGEPRRLTGLAGRRFGQLFRRGISLYAAHLPLDAHARFGNNAVLCRHIGATGLKPFFRYDGCDIGFTGELAVPRTAAALAGELEAVLACRAELGGPASDRTIRRVAVVSGGGGLESLEEAAAAGADLLLTGELTHIMYHPARELGIQVLALGHYASETTGPGALMEEVRRRFKLDCRFIDLPTGR